MSDRPFDIKKLQAIAFWVCAIVLVASLCATGVLASDEQAPDKQSDDLVFIPPASGAPADRLGAGTRDVDISNTKTILLAPPGGGLTATGKPLMIWYFAEPVDGPVTVAISPQVGLARGFVATIDGRFPAGYHGLNLERSKVQLLPDKLYAWEVRHGTSEASSSRGYIEYRVPEKLPQSARDAAAVGYWYDALAMLFDVGFSGQLELNDVGGLRSLSQSTGLDLTKILDAQQ